MLEFSQWCFRHHQTLFTFSNVHTVKIHYISVTITKTCHLFIYLLNLGKLGSGGGCPALSFKTKPERVYNQHISDHRKKLFLHI